MKEYTSKAWYKVIQSFRKTISLQIKNWEVVVKAPVFVNKWSIDNFIEKHKNWIDKKISNRRKSIIDLEKIKEYKKNAKNYIPARVEELALKYGFKYNNLRITSARTRWGSCSSKKNLNFTFRLILTPKEVIDYVIIHELSHLREMNHSRAFWNQVYEIIPDYKKHEKWLKENSDLYSL